MALYLDVGREPVPGYVLVKPLGDGGFGQVWQAVAPGGVHVALKFIRMDHIHSAVELRALEIVKNIRHPHLLDVQFSLHVEDRLVIAMPLCDKNLWERLQECRAEGLAGIPFEELIEYMRDAGRAIDFLNEPRHIGADGRRMAAAHRDVKPHNIFLVGGAVKLADFGLAKALEHSQPSQTASLTPQYAAPEMFQRNVSPRSDQWSLAVTYCQLRTGRLPFPGTMHEMMYGITMGAPELDCLPTDEQSIVARALEKQPESRWPSCREFVKSLGKTAGAVVTIALGTRASVPTMALDRTGLAGSPRPRDPDANSDQNPPLISPDTGREAIAETLAHISVAKCSDSSPPEPPPVDDVVSSQDALKTVFMPRPPRGNPRLRPGRSAPVAEEHSHESDAPTDRMVRSKARRRWQSDSGSATVGRRRRLAWAATGVIGATAAAIGCILLYPLFVKVTPKDTQQDATAAGAPKVATPGGPSLYVPPGVTSILLRLDPPDAGLQVVSSESTDRIRVHAKESPCRIEVSPFEGVRKITITARRVNYRPATIEVELPSVHENPIELKLKRYPYRLALSNVPEEATVKVEGGASRVETVGSTRIVLVEDPPANLEVTVRLSRPGFEDVDVAWHPLDESKPSRKEIEWIPATGVDPAPPPVPIEAPPPLESPGKLEDTPTRANAPTPEAPTADLTIESSVAAKAAPVQSPSTKPDLAFLRIEAGEYEMGSSEPVEKLAVDVAGADEKSFAAERPAHPVRIRRPFLLGQTEVTVEQFRPFVTATGRDMDDGWDDRGDRHPVVFVRWIDAVEFCNWLSEFEGFEPCYTIEGNSAARRDNGNGYRLPTEAEWEYACRAGTRSRYSFGNYWRDFGKYGLATDPAGGEVPRLAPVGHFSANAWGLFDMHGNAAEWCEDWWSDEYYVLSPKDDPAGPSEGIERVVRGGSFLTQASLCRSASRFHGDPNRRSPDQGFRVARTLTP